MQDARICAAARGKAKRWKYGFAWVFRRSNLSARGTCNGLPGLFARHHRPKLHTISIRWASSFAVQLGLVVLAVDLVGCLLRSGLTPWLR